MSQKKNQKYIDNAKIWGKERTYNERTLALEEMKRIAGKHFPQIFDLIDTELYREKEEIKKGNYRRKRQSIIGR